MSLLQCMQTIDVFVFRNTSRNTMIVSTPQHTHAMFAKHRKHIAFVFSKYKTFTGFFATHTQRNAFFRMHTSCVFYKEHENDVLFRTHTETQELVLHITQRTVMLFKNKVTQPIVFCTLGNSFQSIWKSHELFHKNTIRVAFFKNTKHSCFFANYETQCVSNNCKHSCVVCRHGKHIECFSNM